MLEVGGSGNYVVGTAFIPSRHKYDIIFSCRQHIVVGTSKMSTFLTQCRVISSPFWINVEMSEMSQNFVRRLQLRAAQLRREAGGAKQGQGGLRAAAAVAGGGCQQRQRGGRGG